MTARRRLLAMAVALALGPAAARAQPAQMPDRAPELMQLQFNSRATRPPPKSFDGARATAIYKRFMTATPQAEATASAGGAASGTSPP